VTLPPASSAGPDPAQATADPRSDESGPPTGGAAPAQADGALGRLGRVPAVRPVGAVLGGALLYLATAPHTLWWLAPIGFALLGTVLHGRRCRAGLGLGTLFGLGYSVPLLPWIGIYVGPVPWLALAALEAVFLGLGAALIAWVSRLPLAPPWAAALWVATEAATSRVPFGGFPWGKVAYSQADGPFARLAVLGGTPLVSFAVVLTGFALGGLVRALAARPRPPVRTVAVCAVLPALLALLAGLPAAGWVTGTSDAPTREVTVAAVQGSVPRLGLDFNAQRRAVLDYHVRRTEQLADDVAAGRLPRPDLVIWPENSSDIDPLRNPDAYTEISSVVDRVGVPTLIGAVLVEPDGVHTTNTALVWQPGVGPVERNDKRRVQPFGEYLPWRGFFRLLSPYADLAGHFVPGHGPGVVHLGDVAVGVAICWEVAFDDLVDDSVRNGATLLAVPSNNATFGRSDMTYQQLAMSRLRAVEHDRTVVVAATSGVSAIIAPDGTELARTPVFTPAALVRRVPLRASTTLATRLGAGPEWVLTVLGLAGAGWARRRPTAVPAGPAAGVNDTREDEDG
jgi:apolipoprotein N-acyltransferase